MCRWPAGQLRTQLHRWLPAPRTVAHSQEAEGEAQQIRSRARGEAKAITNAAQAEADSVREVARAIARTGENVTRYLLALKYIDALRAILSQPNTQIRFVPRQTAVVQSLQSFGVTPSIIAGGLGAGAMPVTA